MFAAQRREWLLKRLARNRQNIVKEAAKELNVSEGTIRTDLRLGKIRVVAANVPVGEK